MAEIDEIIKNFPKRYADSHKGDFGHTLVIAGSPGYTGAAYLAGLAIGYWKNADEIKRCWMVDRIFKPKMPRKTASDLYAGWCEAVERTLT